MNTKHTQRGQALILIVLGIVGLVALVALAIDAGNAFSDRRHAQNAADATALAAALAKVRGGNLYAKGLAIADINDYHDEYPGAEASTPDVNVEIYNPPGAGCDGSVPNPVNLAADPNDLIEYYIQVIIHSNVDTFFAPIVGIDQLHNCVEAIARAKPATYEELFLGAALVTLKPNGNDTILANGNIDLDINNSGVFDNSTGTCAMRANGNVYLEVDTSYSIVGGYCQNGNVTRIGPLDLGAQQVPYPPQINIPAPQITCSRDGYRTGNTYYPGNYNGITVNDNGNYSFAPGNYCFNGNVTFNGNINVTASGVNFRINAGSFNINGNSTFTCNNLLVYGSGGSGMHFNGNGNNNCTNVTFYLASGNVSWNGNVTNTFTAPQSGPYANLLLYMPYGNNSELTINGNSNNNITGTIMGISAPVTINGNSGTTGYHSQIIGYTITLNGNSDTTINYNDAENYQALVPPSIELSK